MSEGASRIGGRRPAVAGAALVVAAGLIASCSSTSTSSSSSLACSSKRGAAVTGTAPTATGQPAAGWTAPDADLESTRYVASAITSTNVSKLGVAWTMPLTMSTAHTDGAYATTPVTTGAILFQTPMSAGSNAPVTVDGDYVIAGAGVDLSSGDRNMIIAYKLGATGKLPDTVGA